jgi:cellulose synthase operon protein C
MAGESAFDVAKTLPPPEPTGEPPVDLDLSFETIPVQVEPEADDTSLFETAPAMRSVTAPPRLDLAADLGFGVEEPAAAAEPAGEGEDVDSMAFLADPTGGASAQPQSRRAPAAAPAEPVPDNSQDGLEVLDFIDQAAPVPGSSHAADASGPRAKRYQIRKRNGKSFGPYDESTVVQMLREGKLLGNEDVTTDGDNWVVISSVPLMAAVIEELMASPAGAINLSLGDAESSEPGKDPESLRRLQDLYGGRMASSAIVESVDHVAQLKKRLPWLVAGGVVVSILTVGVWLGFTAYGFFGMYKILGPPRVGKHSAAAQLLEQARADLTQDTFPAYRKALDLAKQAEAKAHRAIEPQAMEGQALFYLQRRFGQSSTAASAALRQRLDRLSVIGGEEPDIVKARAGLDAVLGQTADGRPQLEKLLKKQPKDPEALYLLAESWFAQDPSKATTYLKQLLVVNPKSAKALHALGYLETLKGNAAGALEQYRKALVADPDHLSSALEADYLQARIEGTFEGVEADLRKLSADEAHLAPGERAEAEFLLGEADGQHHKLVEAEAEFKQAIALDPESTSAKAAYGRFLLDAHRLDEAFPLVKKAFDAHPKDADLADALARVQLGLGKYLDASRVVADALALHPHDARLLTVEGLADEALGKTAEAGKELELALKTDPLYEEAHVSLGRFLLAQGDMAKAKAEFDTAVTKAPKSARAHTGYGEYLLAAKELDPARREFQAALALDDQDPEAHYGLGRVLVLQSDPTNAEAELRLAEKLDPRQVGLKLELGTLLWKTHKLSDAEKELREATEADIKEPEAPTRLGAVLLAEGNVEGAIASLNKSIIISSKLDDAHYFLTLALLKNNDNNHALAESKTAVEAAPTNADDWYAEGLAYEAVGGFVDAERCFATALKFRPEFADAEQDMGNVQAQLGNDDQAMAAYAKAMTLDPTRARLAIPIGDLQAKNKKFKAAIESYKLALDKDATLVQAYFLIGRSFEEMGKTKDAVTYYRQAIDKDPKGPLAYRALGYYYKAAGDSKRATESFNKYLELKPDADDKETVKEEIGFLKRG